MYYSTIEECNFSSGYYVDSADFESIGEASTANECARNAKKVKLPAIGVSWHPERDRTCYVHFGNGVTLVKSNAGAEKREACLFEQGIEI